MLAELGVAENERGNKDVSQSQHSDLSYLLVLNSPIQFTMLMQKVQEMQ